MSLRILNRRRGYLELYVLNAWETHAMHGKGVTCTRTIIYIPLILCSITLYTLLPCRDTSTISSVPFFFSFFFFFLPLPASSRRRRKSRGSVTGRATTASEGKLSNSPSREFRDRISRLFAIITITIIITPRKYVLSLSLSLGCDQRTQNFFFQTLRLCSRNRTSLPPLSVHTHRFDSILAYSVCRLIDLAFARWNPGAWKWSAGSESDYSSRTTYFYSFHRIEESLADRRGRGDKQKPL